MRKMTKGAYFLSIFILSQNASAKMVSGIVEMRTPGLVVSDTIFDFSEAIKCQGDSSHICNPVISDFMMDSVGIQSLSANRLEEWGPVGPDSGAYNVYSADSIAADLPAVQAQMDSILADMQVMGDTDAVVNMVPWDRVQPGDLIEIITVDGHYAALVPVGNYQGDGYTKYAFYWAYQDDGSDNFYNVVNTSVMRSLHRSFSMSTPITGQFGIDGLGRIRTQKVNAPNQKLYSIPIPNGK